VAGRNLRELAEALGGELLEARRAIIAAGEDRGRAIAALGISPDEADLLAAIDDEIETIHRMYYQRPEITIEIYRLSDDEIAAIRALGPPRPRGSEKPPGSTSRGKTPGRIGDDARGVEDVLEEAERDRFERHAASLAALPKHLQPPRVAKPPKMLAARGRRQRRAARAERRGEATHPHPDAGVLDFGASLRDLDAWIRRGVTSPNLTERAIARRVAGAPLLERALAFVLWHLAVAVDAGRLGYIGAVTGFSRRMLARLSPARNAQGRPIHEDTVSRTLSALRARLASILTIHQPEPETVPRRGLPGARFYLADGSHEYQAYNLYRFWSVDSDGKPHVPKNGTALAPASARPTPDPGTAYPEIQTFRAFAASLEQGGKESGGRGPPDG